MWLDCDASHKNTVTSFTLLKSVNLCQNTKAVYKTEIAIIRLLDTGDHFAIQNQKKNPENGQ